MKNELSTRDYVRFDTFRKIIDLCKDEFLNVKQVNEVITDVSPSSTALYLRYLHYLGCLERDVKQYGRFNNPMNVYKSIRQITNEELIRALTLKEFTNDLSLKTEKRLTVSKVPVEEVKHGVKRTITMEQHGEKMRASDELRRKDRRNARYGKVSIGTSFGII